MITEQEIRTLSKKTQEEVLSRQYFILCYYAQRLLLV